MTPVRFVFSLLFSTLILIPCWSQKASNPWSSPKYKQALSTTKDFPQKHAIVQLEEDILVAILDQAPLRFSEESEKGQPILSLPLADGSIEEFKIVESPVLHPDLGKKYPNIRSFAGQSISEPTTTVRFSWSPEGFQGLVSGAGKTSIIDTYSNSNIVNHVVYSRKDRTKSSAFECDLRRHDDRVTAPTADSRSQQAGDCQLRTYRLAIACTGEYASYHGGTTADALAAMNASITRINGVFENELAVSFQIIPQNTDIIFLNADSDPYDNFDGFEMLDQNQATIDRIIGSGNYDIGHVFSTGGGGVAGLAVVCDFSTKAEGVTGSDQPEGDFFDIDFVAHELGHQFGAEHTFNGTREACGGNNRWLPSAVEPGGGSTIMAYAGICGSQNIQNQSDVYFHSQSLDEIGSFLTSNDNGCPQLTNLNNDAPTADAGQDYIIPISTPFVLNGVSSDPNGGALTYTWEQMDRESSTQPPVSTNSGGPLFRSNPPITSPDRYFPDLRFLARNIANRWEVLPSVARELNFRFTVRDNNIGGGCTGEDDMEITVSNQAGPFLVATPNTSVNWIGGAKEIVTWEVANTDIAPINAASVDILLSVDGGLSFTQTILANTPNTGTAQIVVPNIETSEARIMVRASENIFFDMSDRDFTIEPIRDDFLVFVDQNLQETCSELAVSYEIDVNVSGTLDGTVALSTTGLPSGIEVAYSNNNFIPPSAVNLTLTPDAMVAPGVYDFELNITGTTGTQSRSLSLTIVNASANIVLESPIDNNSSVEPTTTFSWNVLQGAEKYALQISTDLAFSDPITYSDIAINVFSIPTSLSTSTRYYWRVIAEGACFSDKESEVFTFLTSNISCKIYDSEDIPIDISRQGTPTIVSTINIPDEGIITDVNVLNLQIDHTFVSDLAVGLSSPAEDIAVLLFFPCLFEENIDINFDDDDGADSHDNIPCPPADGGRYNPLDELSVFNGSPVNGDWILIVNDDADDDGGSLNTWSLEVCFLQETLTVALSVNAMKTDETCFGENDGTATANVLDGTGNYTFLWSNGATEATIDQLSAGTYTVTVNDGVTEIVESVTITAATEIERSFEIINTSCSDTADGQIMATSTDTNLDYSWPDGSTSTTFSNLIPGIYEVLVSERGSSCNIVDTLEITTPDPILITTEVQDVSCADGTDGSVLAIISGGSPLYTTNADELINLSAGTYTVQVTDANSCVQSSMVTVAEPDPITIEISSTPISIVGVADGMLRATVNGGNGEYTYEWSNGASSASISNLAEGGYEVTVVDQNACLKTASAMVAGIDCLPVTITFNTEEITTLEGADGSITASVDNEQGVYTYLWSTGAVTATITDLQAGTYSVTVTDEQGCTISQTAVLNAVDCVPFNIDFVTTEPNCGEADGSITAMLEGDNDSFIYQWSTDMEGPEITDLSSGTYTLTVTDESGCFSISDVVLGTTNDLTAPIIDCPEDIVLTNTCNIPVTYELVVTDDCSTFELELLQGLESGTEFPRGTTLVEYMAMDEAGNSTTCTFNVTQNSDISVEYDPTFLLQNNGDQTLFAFDLRCSDPNVIIADFLTVSGGVPPYNFSVFTGSSADDATDYLVNIVDAMGCLYQEEVSFLNTDAAQDLVSPVLDVVIKDTSTGADGGIEISVDDRFGVNSYTWTKDNITVATTQNLENIEAGVYRLDITDQYNCMYSFDYEVNQLTTSTNQLLLEETVQILPNPTTGNFQIKIDLPNPTAITIDLYDLNGRLLQAAVKRDNSNIPIDINISNYPKGIYLAKISAEQEVIVKRVVLL